MILFITNRMREFAFMLE